MAATSSEIILHNYPQSPVAEKIRVALGMKGVSWRSVEIPRIPPKPFLIKLTGGYRRTPVLQIGSDIYCDSQRIISELENRFPSPSFFPTNDNGLMWCLSRWSDGYLFDLSTKIIFGSTIGDVPADFAADRGRLYFGKEWEAGMKAAHERLSHLAAQMRVGLNWLNDQLSDGRTFLLGDRPAAIDVQFYSTVWFLRGRWSDGPACLSEFPALCKWEAAMQKIGYGTFTSMNAEEAIVSAANSEPSIITIADDMHDPQGIRTGMDVLISPDVDGGEEPVRGKIVFSSCTRITLHRHDADAGDLHVHFPRAGYVVMPV